MSQPSFSNRVPIQICLVFVRNSGTIIQNSQNSVAIGVSVRIANISNTIAVRISLNSVFINGAIVTSNAGRIHDTRVTNAITVIIWVTCVW